MYNIITTILSVVFVDIVWDAVKKRIGKRRESRL